MIPVNQLAKKLETRPATEILQGLQVRNYAGEADIQPWLELRHRAFARERIGVREWRAADFRTEFTNRWWWRPEWMWLAFKAEGGGRRAGEPPEGQDGVALIGSVVLAMRGEPKNARPVVHWLIVHPRFRRGGIARALMSHLEAATWDAGHREIFLETHSAWVAAGKFYEALGYRQT